MKTRKDLTLHILGIISDYADRANGWNIKSEDDYEEFEETIQSVLYDYIKPNGLKEN